MLLLALCDSGPTNLLDDIVHDRIGLLQVGGEHLYSNYQLPCPILQRRRTYALLSISAQRRHRPPGALRETPLARYASWELSGQCGSWSCPEGTGTHGGAPQRRDCGRHGWLGRIGQTAALEHSFELRAPSFNFESDIPMTQIISTELSVGGVCQGSFQPRFVGGQNRAQARREA